MSDTLTLTIQIIPSGEELEVQLSAHTTATELIGELINNGVVPKTDLNGSLIAYELVQQRNGDAFSGNKSLLHLGVQQQGILLCRPKLESDKKRDVPEPSSIGDINVIIKIMPGGEEIEVALSIFSTGAEIIEALIRNERIPRTEGEGNPYVYSLRSEEGALKIKENASLSELGIREGAVIWCIPELINGSGIRKGMVPSTEDHLMVVIRMMPSGVEVEVEVPASATGAEIIEALILDDLMPRTDQQGNPQLYKLTSSFSNKEIEDRTSLAASGIQNGEILYCSPDIRAGGSPGNLIYQLPSVLKLGEKATCQVRISREGLQELLLWEGLDPNAKMNKIEINDVMEVTLEENALHELLKIRSLNRTEQIISDDSYSVWNFDLYPETKKPGFTALLLRVTMVEMLEGYGERKKDVFLLNHEVEITHGHSQNDREFIHDFRQVYEWTERFRQEIYDFIRDNHTGRALSKLANFYQQCDRDVFHSVLLLQAQWNEGRNQHLTNRIMDNEWYTVQARVNMGILELVKDIEAHIADQAWNGAGNGSLLERMIGRVRAGVTGA